VGLCGHRCVEDGARFRIFGEVAVEPLGENTELRLDPETEPRAVKYVKEIRALAVDQSAMRAQRADAKWWLREHGFDDDALQSKAID